jgi:thiamine biosynthesis protein ThiI
MRLLVLISGGIDSPVAAQMMADVGAQITTLHMENVPFGGSVDQVARIIERLRVVTGQPIPFYTAPHGEVNLARIAESRNPHIRCVLCKRFMLRVAEALARERKIKALVTGDSLGQVASQTLQNIRVEEEAVDMQVIRPLVGMDKQEIVERARAIGTYELSIEDPVKCDIVPRKPSTRANLKKVYDAEAEMDVDKMVGDCLDGMRKL